MTVPRSRPATKPAGFLPDAVLDPSQLMPQDFALVRLRAEGSRDLEALLVASRRAPHS